MRTERPREEEYLVLGAATCEHSVERMPGSWYGSELDTLSLLLLVHPSHVFGGGLCAGH